MDWLDWLLAQEGPRYGATSREGPGIFGQRSPDFLDLALASLPNAGLSLIPAPASTTPGGTMYARLAEVDKTMKEARIKKEPQAAAATPKWPAPSVSKKSATTTTGTPPAAKTTAPAPTGQGVQAWVPTVAPLAQEYGVPMDVALGIMDIESGGDPNARSKAGAMGLYQVMPGNFAPGENGMDPETNIRRGLRMLADRFGRFGNWESAAASYFGAIGADGKPSNARDVNGVSGVQYVEQFKNARTRYANP